MGKRHHFVPRFYLTAFRSTDRRIHLYNIPRGLSARDVSLRDQCHAHNLYGADGELEAAFADLEGTASRVITTLLKEPRPPVLGSVEHAALLAFAAFQLVRTLAARISTTAMSEKLATAVFDHQPPPEWQLTANEAMAMTLGAGAEMLATMQDLGMALVQTDGAHLVTSDNPAFKYNQYCEGVRHSGVTGTKARGFQVFLPLGPKLLLLLYDSGVYKVGTRGAQSVVTANGADVRNLNRLQFMSAQHNVYFAEWSLAASCADLAKTVAQARASVRPRVMKAYNVTNERDVLLHQYWPMPQLNLQLTFVSIRRNARRVDLFDRAQLLRDGRKASARTPSAGAIRFETRRP